MCIAATSNSAGKEIEVSDFELGVIKKQNVDGWAMDLSFIEKKINLSIAGIVGNDLWQDYQIIIDFSAQQIFIYESGDDLQITTDNYDIASLPWITTVDEHKVVELEINGVNRHMTFDTGAGINVLDHQVSDSFEELSSVKVSHILIEKMPFIESDLSSLNQNANELTVDGILSASSLNASIVIIDNKTNKLHLCWEKSNL